MKTAVELQPLGGVHGHQLDRVLPGLRLVVAGLQRGVGQEGRQRAHDLAGFGVGRQRLRQQRHAAGDRARPLLVDRQRHGVLAETLLRHEGLGGVDQFVEVLDAVLAFLLGAVEVDQAAALQHCSMISRSVWPRVASRSESISAMKAAQVAAALAGDRADALVQAACAGPCRVLQGSSVRAPMPRAGKFTTRRKLVSSFGFSSSRR